MTFQAAEPGIDAIVLAREVTISTLYGDVNSIGSMNDVSNVFGHIHSTCLTAIKLPKEISILHA